MAQPVAGEQSVLFTLDDPDSRWSRVSLDCDDAVRGRRRFRRTATGWLLALPRPSLGRLEYRLVLTDRRGRSEVVCDPDNPERVDTAFGERSVAVLPGYAPPPWLAQQAPAGTVRQHTWKDEVIGELPLQLWSPESLRDGTPAPLLVVHDGPEYLDLAALGEYAAATIAGGGVRPFRMACLQPVDRDSWYSANPDYMQAELRALEDLSRGAAPVDAPYVTIGASLGGLTALLVALAMPSRFAGVLSQSGSFFRPDLDEQESGYPHFERVTAAVAVITTAGPAEPPLRIALTCGRNEENFGNNDAMAAALADAGHLVTFTAVDDLHNYTAWRDSLHPALTELLRSVWGAGEGSQ